MEERLVKSPMEEIGKAVGQWIVGNVGWSILIFLFILSLLFKITKREIDPLGWLLGWIGKNLTKNVREDVADLKKDTTKKFDEIKQDRNKKIDELKSDYNKQIKDLKTDLDAFEKRTNSSIDEMKKGTTSNCEMMKTRMDAMEKSNDMQTVRQIRAHILDFSNSCMNKRRHTKLEFENIIEENNKYKDLVEKYKIQNDVYKEDYEFIMKIYHRCQEEGTFLKESDA